jgi:hypothetical protein
MDIVMQQIIARPLRTALMMAAAIPKRTMTV